MGQWSELPVARRAWLRMALWGAAGLSLLPGCSRGGPIITCYKPATPPANGPGAPGLTRWRELGRIWRELSAHSRGKYEGQDGEAKLKALEAEMASALAALPAWTELRTLFEERAAHVYREHYFLATCYDMSAWNPVRARGDVERQMTALQKLVEEGKLTKEAAEKAAQAVAVDAEYLTHLRAMHEKTDPEERNRFRPIHEQYVQGKLEAGDEAVRAGRHVVEFEAEQPGLLTEEADG